MNKLSIGSTLPDFTGIDQNGEELNASSFNGKRLVIYFYPKDNTPGCTVEACNLRDNYATLKKKGFAILGVSADDDKKHLKFIEKYDLPFPLLADVELKVIKAYDVWGEKKFMGRTYMGTNRVTFLINEKGTIEHIIDKVETKNHAAQVLNTWGLD